jgi:hypothetical protein
LDLDAYPPDALEVRSHNTPTRAEGRIRAIAGRLGLGLLCNSDAHHVSDLGAYYNVLPERPRDEEELVTLLRGVNGNCGRGNGG